jgi:hypothetical protein
MERSVHVSAHCAHESALFHGGGIRLHPRREMPDKPTSRFAQPLFSAAQQRGSSAVWNVLRILHVSEQLVRRFVVVLFKN